MYSHIEGRVTSNALGMIDSREYFWIGKSPKIIIDSFILVQESVYDKNKQIITIGQYRLKIIDKEFDRIVCIRMDYPFWWTQVLSSKVLRLLRLVYSRLILTLVIWNLADYSLGSVPSIQDLHIIKIIRSKYGNARKIS